MKKYPSDNNGFTLVELIVVIVILAIMAAIIVPIALSHIDEARMEQEYQNAKVFMTAIQTEMMNSYSDFITGDAESNIYGTVNFIAGSGTNNNTEGDVDLRDTEFAKNVLNKTDLDVPYALVFYTKAINNYEANTEGIYESFNVYSIMYWSSKDKLPLYFDFDKNTWEYGNLYTAGFMYRGSVVNDNNKKNRILDGHKHAGEKISIYIVSYDGTNIIDLNDEIEKKMKEYNK